MCGGPHRCWAEKKLPSSDACAGRLPFEGKDKQEIKKNITANNLAGFPSFLTPQCQSFVRAMLTYHFSERPSCAELLRHPYITMYTPTPKPQLPGIISLQAFTLGAAGMGQHHRLWGWHWLTVHAHRLLHGIRHTKNRLPLTRVQYPAAHSSMPAAAAPVARAAGATA